MFLPSQGRGIIDDSLLGNDLELSKYYISAILVINILFFLYLVCVKNDLISWLLIIFNAILLTIILCDFKNNISNFNLLYSYGNFILAFTFLCFTIFIMDNYKAYKSLICYILVFIFLLYAVAILLELPLSDRLDILYIHPNHLGNALAFGVLFLSFAVLSFKSNILKAIIYAITFVLILGLTATLSRGAWLGACIGLLFGLVLAFIYSKNKLDILKILLSLALFIGISIIIVNPDKISERFDMSVSDTEVSTINRVTLWKTSLCIIKDHPLIGIGIGNFEDTLEKNYKPEFLNNERFSSALNNYLTLAAEAGIPLLLFYIFIIIYILFLAIGSIIQSMDKEEKCFKSDNKLLSKIIGFLCINNYLYIKIGMLAGVISLLIFGLTTYTLTRVYSNLLIWSSLGYIIAD